MFYEPLKAALTEQKSTQKNLRFDQNTSRPPYIASEHKIVLNGMSTQIREHPVCDTCSAISNIHPS